MPALFVGHGSPMNALEDNRFTAVWRRIGQALPRCWRCPPLEHYLPLLYSVAVQRKGEPVSFPVEGIDRGSFSMLTVGIGTF